MTTHHTLRRGPVSRALPAVVAFVLAMTLAAAADADSIKLGTLWIENVAIDSFDGNELNYLVNGVPNKQYLTKIDGFKLAAYPQLEEAEKAITAKKDKDTLAAFKAVRGKAKEPWLKLWLDARLVPLMNKEGENLGAINTYILLLDQKAPQSFLETPPVNATKALSKEDKAKVQEKLKAHRKNAKDKTPIADALDELIEASDPGSAPVTPDKTNPATPGGDMLETVIPLPEFMLKDRPDNITKLLARGRFDAALERIPEELKAASTGGRTAAILFQRGIAQYYLAVEMAKDKSKAKEAKQLFEDAGLSFYRIPTYFKNSPYAGYALIETAAVHVKINRPDVAKTLLDQALANGSIDPEDKRLVQVQEELSALTAK